MSDYIDPTQIYLWRLAYQTKSGSRLEYIERTARSMQQRLVHHLREDEFFKVVRLDVLVPINNEIDHELMRWRNIEVTPPVWKLVDRWTREVLAFHED